MKDFTDAGVWGVGLEDRGKNLECRETGILGNLRKIFIGGWRHGRTFSIPIPYSTDCRTSSNPYQPKSTNT